jgi:hypothetical protein
VLLGADAHPGAIETSLRSLGASEASRYKLDCFKVSHHGSKANTSPELLKIIDCTCFAFSTDGSRHGHPDPEAIARILTADSRKKDFGIQLPPRQHCDMGRSGPDVPLELPVCFPK